jgi:hypothetical protein
MMTTRLIDETMNDYRKYLQKELADTGSESDRRMPQPQACRSCPSPPRSIKQADYYGAMMLSGGRFKTRRNGAGKNDMKSSS